MVHKPIRRIHVYGLFGAILCSWIASTWFGLVIVDAVYHGEITGVLIDNFMQNKDSVPLSDYRSEIWRMAFLAHLLVVLFLTVALVWRFRSAGLILTVLLVGDLIIIAGSIVFGGEFRIWREPSIPEIFQNSKELFIAGTFFWLWRNRGSSIVFAAFSVLFAWLFVDDAFMYHERAGSFLDANLDLNAFLVFEGLREQDIGEILSLAVPLTFIMPFIVYAYLKSDRPDRRTSHVVLSLVAALGFFGVVVDIFDRYTGLGSFQTLFVYIEDGGEMIVVSTIVAFAVSLVWVGTDKLTSLDK